MHPGLDPGLWSSIDGEYSVTRAAANVACYSPCVRRSRDGASARTVGGRI